MTSTLSEAFVFLTRWIELSLLGKATVLLALGLGAAWLVGLVGRGRASVRHLVLAATFGTLAALPLIMATVPGVVFEVSVARSADQQALTLSQPASPLAVGIISSLPQSRLRSVPSWPVVLRWIWIVGAILFAAPLLADVWRLRRLVRHGLPWPELCERMPALAAESGIRRPVEVLLHEGIAAPLTWGWWHAVILLPVEAREWPESELRCALVHELEHVRRGDWAVQLAARVICAAYWVHPLVWTAWRRLCLEAERACDDAVIQGAERTAYAEQLVSLAQRMSSANAQPALGMANRSDLSQRVASLLDDRRRRGRAGLLAAASAMIVFSLAAAGVAPIHAVAASAKKQSGASAKPDRRVKALDRAIYEAAEDGDVADVEKLINAGANVNARIDGDGSPLIGAARKGRLDAVRLLLDRGADPNMAVEGDGNPLIVAARDGQVAAVTLLLDRGARIDEVVSGDETALIQASAKGRLNVVKLLVERRASVILKVWVEEHREWRSPLSMARKGGHTAVVEFLVSAGARD